MVKNKEYSNTDYFISIGFTRDINDMEEGFDDPQIPESPNFLRIKFDDVLVDFGAENRAFTQENAEEIFKFLEHVLPTSTIHIHCQMGQSRSAAIGVSLDTIFRMGGYVTDITHESGYIVPNKTVMRIMLENREKLTIQK